MGRRNWNAALDSSDPRFLISFVPCQRGQLLSFTSSVSLSQILNVISYELTKPHFAWPKKQICPCVWCEDIQEHNARLFVMGCPKDPCKTLTKIWHNLKITQAMKRNVMGFIPYYMQNSSFDISFSSFSWKDMGRRQHLSSTHTILRQRWVSCPQVCLGCMLLSHL